MSLVIKEQNCEVCGRFRRDWSLILVHRILIVKKSGRSYAEQTILRCEFCGAWHLTNRLLSKEEMENEKR